MVLASSTTAAGPSSPLTPHEAPRTAWDSRAKTGTMTPGSASRYGRIWGSFLTFSQALEADHLTAISTDLCEAFLQAPLANRGEPRAATSRFRLTVLRAAFSELVIAGVVDADPTRSLSVEAQQTDFQPVALTPFEVLRLRSAARMRPGDTLRPATVELALAGLTHGEIARTVVGDLHSTSRCLEIRGPGGNRRTASLDEAAVQLLLQRVAAQRRAVRRGSQPWEPSVVPVALTRPLASYPLESVAPTISTNITRGLTAAGVHRPGVRPRSLREYAANRVYAITGRVEDVASRLGLVSLDSARQLVDDHWQQRFGDEVRRDPG